MQLSQLQKRVVLIWILVLILMSASGYFLVLANQTEAINDKQDTLHFTKQKNEALKQSLKERENEVIDVEGIRASIPETMHEDEIIRLINRASDQSGTLVESFKYVDRSMINLTEASNQKLQQLTMQINGEANNLTSLNEFVSKLENSKRFVNIQSFNFQINEETTFQIEFQVYAKDFDE